MGTNPTKAASNVYCQARLEASKYNDKLRSREGAAELLGISPSSLADYELGITKIVPVDKVVLMADLYNAPELLNGYCHTSCPIGFQSVPRLEMVDMNRATVQLLASLHNAEGVDKTLLALMADGEIDEAEKPQLKGVLERLDVLSQSIETMKLWAKKHLD